MQDSTEDCSAFQSTGIGIRRAIGKTSQEPSASGTEPNADVENGVETLGGNIEVDQDGGRIEEGQTKVGRTFIYSQRKREEEDRQSSQAVHDTTGDYCAAQSNELGIRTARPKARPGNYPTLPRLRHKPH